MNKKELIKQVARETGTTVVQTKEIVDKVFNTIVGSVNSGNKVSVVGFGVFDRRISVSRTISHAVTKKKTEVPGRKIPTFYPSKKFKRIVRG